MFKNKANSAFGTQHSALKDRLFYWLPPLLWLVAIFFFSTDNFSDANTGGVIIYIFRLFIPSLTEEQFDPIHFLIRKTAHFTEYAVLAVLLFRAFRSGAFQRWQWRWAIFSVLIVITYALLDELHQTFTANRSGSVYDSMIDTVGGLGALLFLWWTRRAAPSITE